jgi:hypothetical protein
MRQSLFQRFARWNIEMVGGLVVHQYVNTRVDNFARASLPFSPPERSLHMFIDIVTCKQKLREKRTQFTGSRIRWRDASQLHDDLVPVIKIIKLLRVISDLYFGPPTYFTVMRVDLLQYGTQKSVLPDRLDQ